MEQINYQEEYKRLFSAYRTNSAVPDEVVLQSIEVLVDKFPFCQPLHLIYASASKNNPEKFEGRLTKASLRTPQRETLYQTIHHPEKLILKGNIVLPVKEEKITDNQNIASGFEEIIEQVDSDTITERQVRSSTQNTVVIDEERLAASGQIQDPQESIEEDPVLQEIIEAEPFSEIQSEADTIENGLLMEDVDYFTIDKSVADLLQQDKKTDLYQNNSKISESKKADPKNIWSSATQNVSKYHDDKLPYTFLWWLNKTRKEYSDTYQPYVDFKLDITRPIRRKMTDELNQQIIENIFHLQIPLEDKKRKKTAKTVEFKLKKKDEEDIIEKFIKEDPHIRPMQPEKIDTENKARKSSEDLNDLVSETLARIYVEQMLFDKAIDTYKKLSLKFPEKNAYFADQISDLEKRLN